MVLGSRDVGQGEARYAAPLRGSGVQTNTQEGSSATAEGQVNWSSSFAAQERSGGLE
jgi:hypothetical protein